MSDNTFVEAEAAHYGTRRSVQGKHYRKFEHRHEPVRRTHRRQRRNLRLLLKTRPEKAEEMAI